MAELEQLATIYGNDQQLLTRIKISIIIKAVEILTLNPQPTDGRALWAKEALMDPDSKCPQIANYMIGANHAAVLANILGSNKDAVLAATQVAIDRLFAPVV